MTKTLIGFFQKQIFKCMLCELNKWNDSEKLEINWYIAAGQNAANIEKNKNGNTVI